MDHAQGHLDYLNAVGDSATESPIGSTSMNLEATAVGEHSRKHLEMYPGMARIARDEGFTDVAELFETLAKAEKSHAGRFQKALDKLSEL